MWAGDVFDPNTWEAPPAHEFRIYLDDQAQTWAVVDEEDYYYFVKWRWHINQPHPARAGTKRYAVRSQSNGRRAAPKLSLHVEIHLRAGVAPESEEHTLVDHIDGDELNCRRENLRWATPSMNRLNRKQGCKGSSSAVGETDLAVMQGCTASGPHSNPGVISHG